jgi:hypothetical protein
MTTMEMTPSAPPSGAAAETVLELATAYMASAALHVASRLDIADQLADGPAPVDTLARQANVRPDALYRVLRALASVGVFDEQPGRVFALNGPSAALRSGPGSLRDLALFLTDPLHMRVHADLMYSVKTGQPAVEDVEGMPVFELFARDAAESASFNDAMTSLSAAVVPALLRAYDFSGVRVLADIAGGQGLLIASVLHEYPAMRGMLLDLEQVVAGAHVKLRSMGVDDRCAVMVGNFFEAVPPGADAYLMKHIIHDWDDDKALTILSNVRTALDGRSDGRVLIVEAVLPSGSGPHIGKLSDLEMMVFPGGRERTADEFRNLLDRAGFSLTTIVATDSPMSIIEARAR